MAVRPFKRTNRQAIPRRDLVGRSVTIVLDARNRPQAPTLTPFTLISCTIQPASGNDLQVLPEGLRDAEVFNIYTNTQVNTTKRGSLEDADEVFLDNPFTNSPGYFKVFQAKVWQNGLIPHYHLLVVRKNP